MIPEVFEIWKNLDKYNVEYITIGGFAVNMYGYTRNTGDVDIYLNDTEENRLNFNTALKSSGLIEFPNVIEMQFIPGYTDVSLGFGMRLDVLTSVKGLENISFQVLRSDATIVEIAGVKVYFLDYKNLIISKKASNRTKDILDIEELKKINPEN